MNRGSDIQRDNLLVTPQITRRFKPIQHPYNFAENLRPQGIWMKNRLEQLTEQTHYDIEEMNTIPFRDQE